MTHLRWFVHNVIAHPLLVLCPPLGWRLHDLTAPEDIEPDYYEFSFVTWTDDVLPIHDVIQTALDNAGIDYGGVIGSMKVDLDDTGAGSALTKGGR